MMPVPAASRINSRSTPTRSFPPLTTADIDPKQPRSKSNPNRANTFKPRSGLPFDPRELCQRLDLVKIEGDVVKARRRSLGEQLTPGSPSRPASVTVETLLAKSLEHHRSFNVDRVLQQRSGGPSSAQGRLARPSSPQSIPPKKELAKRLETHSRVDKDKGKSKGSTTTSTATSSDADGIPDASNASVIAVACMPPIPKTSAKNASPADPNPPSNPLRSPPSGRSKKSPPQLKTLPNPSKHSTNTTPLTSPLPNAPVTAISSFTSSTSSTPNISDSAKVHPLSHQVLTMYSNPLAPLSPGDRSAQQLTPRQLAQIRRRTLQTTDRFAARNQFSNSAKWTSQSRVSQNFMPNAYSYAPHPQPDTDFIDLSLHGPGSTVVPLTRSASEGQKRKPRPRSRAFEQFSTAQPSILATGTNVSPIPRSAQPYINWSQPDEEISSEDRASTGGNRLTVNFSLRRRLSREGAAGNAAAQRASMGGQRSSRVLNGEGVGHRNSRALSGEFFAQRHSARYSKDGVTLTPGIADVQRVEKRDSMEAKRRRARREREGGGGIEMGSSPVLPALSPFPPLMIPGQTNLNLAGVGRRGNIGQMAATPAGKQLSNDRLNGPMPRRPSNEHINAQQQQLNRRPSAGQLNRRPSSDQLSGHSSRHTSGTGPGLTHAHTVSRPCSGGAAHPASPVHRRKGSGSAQIRSSNAHIASQAYRRKSGGQLSIFPALSPSPSPSLAPIPGSASGPETGAGGVGIGVGAMGPTPAGRASKRASKRASRITTQHTPTPPTLQGAGQSQSGTESETGTPTGMRRRSQGQMYPSVGVPPRERPRRSSAASPLPVIPSHTEPDLREGSQSQQQQQQRGRQPRHSLPTHTSVPVPESPPRSKSRASLYSLRSTKSIKSVKSTKSTKSTFSLMSTKSQRNTLQKRRKSNPRHVTQEQLDALAVLTAPVPPPDGSMTEASLRFLEEQRRRLAEKQRRESLVSSRRGEGGGGGGGRDSSVEGSVRGSRVGAGSVAGSWTGPGNNRASSLARRPESAMSGTSVSVTEPFPVFKGKGKEKAGDFSASPSTSVSVSEKQFGAGWERESMVLAKGGSLTGLTPESVRLLREREKLVRWKAEREKAEFERREREKERVAAANEKWDAEEKGGKKKKERGCLGGLWPF